MTVSIQVAVLIGICATLSLALNILLVYYIRISIMKFAEISDGIINQKDSIEEFATHLQYVYELEMFYGDETLKGLLDHARTLSDSFDEYEEFYELFDLEEIPEPEVEEEEADATQT